MLLRQLMLKQPSDFYDLSEGRKILPLKSYIPMGGKEVIMRKRQIDTTRRFFIDSLPLLGAIFLMLASVSYIMYRNWNEKLYIEKWKDYEDCGI